MFQVAAFVSKYEIQATAAENLYVDSTVVVLLLVSVSGVLAFVCMALNEHCDLLHPQKQRGKFDGWNETLRLGGSRLNGSFVKSAVYPVEGRSDSERGVKSKSTTTSVVQIVDPATAAVEGQAPASASASSTSEFAEAAQTTSRPAASHALVVDGSDEAYETAVELVAKSIVTACLSGACGTQAECASVLAEHGFTLLLAQVEKQAKME